MVGHETVSSRERTPENIESMHTRIVFVALYVAAPLLAPAPSLSDPPMYRWTDSDGVTHFTDHLPPETCQTDSCGELRTQLNQSVESARESERRRKEYERQKEAERRSRLTSLPKDAVICASLSAMRQYDEGDYRLRNHLKAKDRCLLLPRSTRYTVRGETIDSYVPVVVFSDQSSLEVWTWSFYVPLENEW